MTATQEFVDVLNEIKGTKTGVSGSRIKRLTDIAVQNVHSESQIMPEVLSNIKSAASSHKLGALYVLDSIAKAYKAEAERKGEFVTPNATEGTFAAGLVKLGRGLKDSVDLAVSSVSEDQKEKVSKLLDIWSKDKVFPQTIIDQAKGSSQASGSATGSSASGASTVDASSLLKNLASLSGNPAPVQQQPAAMDTQSQQAAMIQMLQNLQQTGQLPQMPQPPQIPGMPQMPQGFPQMPQMPPGFPQFPMPQQQQQQPPQDNGFPFGQHADNNGGNRGRMNNDNSSFSQRDAFNQYKSRDTRGGNMRERDNHSAYSRRGDRNRSRSPPRRDNYGRMNNNNNNRTNNPSSNGLLYGSNEKNIPGTPHYRQRNFSMDPNLPGGSIKVYSRTIFIGGVPSGMNDHELATILRPYAEVQSVILNSERKHAFVKVYSRSEAEEVISSFSKSHDSIGLRLRWGVGFGPRDCCDYQHGVSIIPIARLTDADKRWITMAQWGGIGSENHLVPGFVMEEPDIEVGEGVTSKAISKKMPTDGSRNGPRSTKPGEPDDLYTDPLNQPQAPSFLQNNQGKPNLLQGLFGNGQQNGAPPPPPGLAGYNSQPQYNSSQPPPAPGASSASPAPGNNDASSQLANLMAMLQQQKK
ncbi:hypothetical protein WICPIJ_001188 [Wickerhamomyces pijperi]|uniref:Protein NRD1 n=1 Tax=Wickerhamomyces pijperi TaxID=599730 RepID=A0A9P8TQ47_WICPI|nr:hypothetical protein WICPIJ_001188 [Wickerhamomyces pijperi]